MEEVSASESEIKEQIGSIKEEYDTVVKKENKIKESKIKQDQEMEKYAGMIHDCKSSLNHWKKKLAKLELQV